MALSAFLPLIAATVILGVVVGAQVSRRANRLLTRVALRAFGRYIADSGWRQSEHRRILRAAHVPTTYRTYAAKTVLYAGLAALIGSIYSLYFAIGIIELLQIETEAVAAVLPSYLGFLASFASLPSLSTMDVFFVFLTTSATLGVAFGAITYWARWTWLKQVAENRRRRIDATIPRTVAYLYALSRSGMSFPEVMRSLAENRDVYGDTADEVAVAVNEMDLFGTDLITAIKRMGDRTPSEMFEEFSENLASVLQSGRSISQFLERQYDRFQEENEHQQEQILELLATLAEVYVTVFVAGSLFLLTILVIVGLAVGKTLPILQAIGYVLLPLGNLAFILYVSTVTESIRSSQDRTPPPDPIGGTANIRRRADEESVSTGPEATFAMDGGVETRSENWERLYAFEELRGLRETIAHPVESMLIEPMYVFYVTIPLALIFLAYRLPAAFIGGFDATLVDDVLIQTTLFVLATFAVVYEIHRRRIRRIEDVVPDFLDRLAGTNEAGMTIVESVGNLRRGDLGMLNPEMDRIWSDVLWGADIQSSLFRFERRIRTGSITRIVTLITRAMSASGDIANVLRIAADQAKDDRRLERRRRQEMFTYLAVIYVSFFVFLVIIAALTLVLIPTIPDVSTLPATTGNLPGVGALAGLGGIDKEAYTLVFFHTAIIQGLFSGLIAGQMGSGSPRDGAKHAAILMLVTYVGFLIIA